MTLWRQSRYRSSCWIPDKRWRAFRDDFMAAKPLSLQLLDPG
jgi:hypothetical protein